MVVAPRSVLPNWAAEAARFTPGLRVLLHEGPDRDDPGPRFADHDLVFTTYGVLRADADAIFLSCTNTTQMEAIEDIELALGKPVINSNQAVLWGCVQRLGGKLGALPPMPALGRLMSAQ